MICECLSSADRNISRAGFIRLLAWLIGTDWVCFNAKALCRIYCFSDDGKSYFYYVGHIVVCVCLMNRREVSWQKKTPVHDRGWLSFCRCVFSSTSTVICNTNNPWGGTRTHTGAARCADGCCWSRVIHIVASKYTLVIEVFAICVCGCWPINDCIWGSYFKY